MLFYNVLDHSEWFCLLNENSADSAVNDLSAIMLEAINLAISYIKSKDSTFPRWFSDSLKYCGVAPRGRSIERPLLINGYAYLAGLLPDNGRVDSNS
jgi:hypothetical protein